jgi:hypothetical protein
MVVGCVVGCSSSGPAKVDGMVGPTGGTVTASDGSSVVFPAGALSAPTPISIAPQSGAASPIGAQAVGLTYLFGPEGTQFSAPVDVTLAFVTEQLPTGMTAADIVIYTAPAGSSEFTQLETIPTDTGHVRAQTTHFSIFVPAVHLMSGGDAAQPGDMAVSPGADLAGDCTIATTTTSGGCTLTKSCSGHAYQLLCQPNDMGSSSCTCSQDGGITVTAFPAGQTCLSGAGGNYTWTHTCMFP